MSTHHKHPQISSQVFSIYMYYQWYHMCVPSSSDPASKVPPNITTRAWPISSSHTPEPTSVGVNDLCTCLSKDSNQRHVF